MRGFGTYYLSSSIHTKVERFSIVESLFSIVGRFSIVEARRDHPEQREQYASIRDVPNSYSIMILISRPEDTSPQEPIAKVDRFSLADRFEMYQLSSNIHEKSIFGRFLKESLRKNFLSTFLSTLNSQLSPPPFFLFFGGRRTENQFRETLLIKDLSSSS